MFKKIPYNKAFVNKEDINIVKKSLKTQILTSGPYLNNLEYKFQKKLNVKNSIACNSGTSALHLAFKSLNIKKNDIVILPIINFKEVFYKIKNCITSTKVKFCKKIITFLISFCLDQEFWIRSSFFLVWR